MTARIAETFGAAAAPGVYAAYERARPGGRPVDVLMDLITDELLRVPALRLAEARAAVGNPVRAYQFDLPQSPTGDGSAPPTASNCPSCATTSGHWSHAPLVAGLGPAGRDGLAAAVHRAWIAFVRTGDPGHPALPRWDPYGSDPRTTMRFDSVVIALGDLAGDSRRLFAEVPGPGPMI
ncbi:carboxylesterase family protein [Streptomyces sp. G-G2]|uniref:carboxylesterase family protein n=1 Tax=Streptomyces sp. G-G2 TaxID=3046201 RepID=UPI0024BAA1F3|nr:carboxylesterase family protein [Streptomyces sp. G-G2]MDJ0381992.1 carboxylesterase family protein [Streptomyces sp. G-G2]